MTAVDYPLLFKRRLLNKTWGARRFEQFLRIRIDAGENVGESWEISDHPNWESVVANGPLAGATLRQLMQFGRGAVAGDAQLARGGRFPLLIKFIDTSDRLSVQVHPSDGDAERMRAPDGGKNEAWFFVHTEPDAKIWAGLAPLAEFADLERARTREEVESRLREIRPTAGDAVAIEAGTIHAIGAGVTVCEVQQTSDITYRIYDWGRPASADRPLHLDEARAVARGELRPEIVKTDPRMESATELPSPGAFRWRIRRSARRFEEQTGGRFRVVVCVGGRGMLYSSANSAERIELAPGASALVPAAVTNFTIEPSGDLQWIVVEPAENNK